MIYKNNTKPNFNINSICILLNIRCLSEILEKLNLRNINIFS